MSTQLLRRPKRSVLRTRVLAALRDRIIDGSLSPGAGLGEVQLAADLEVSRTPVREALHQLVEEGFAEYTPHCGARVVKPTQGHVTDVFQIREALEGVSAREAARKFDPVRLVNVRRRFEEIRSAVVAGDYRNVGDFLHDEMLEACGNVRLQRLISVYTSQIHWFQKIVSGVPGQLLQAFREHESILAALESRDGDWAESAARAHVRNTLQTLLPELPTGEPPLRRVVRRDGRRP
jgi:DNA-binding GntR family transcriptional regulator